MKFGRLIPPLLLGACLVTSLAANAEADSLETSRKKFEGAGMAGGLVIGGLLGGAPAAILTGAIGGWLGDRVAVANDTGDRQVRYDTGDLQDRYDTGDLQARYEELQEELLALEDQNRRLRAEQVATQRELDARRLVASTGGAPLQTSFGCCGESALVLHFRSGSTDVEPHYRNDLARFVRTAGSLSEVVVELTGHSDRRGSSEENLALSRERLQAVEETLRELGLKGVIIETTALGSRRPLTAADDLEGNFFDRRVELRLRNSRGELLSSLR